MTDKLAAVLAALGRGERPSCPICHAAMLFEINETAGHGVHFACGSEVYQGADSVFVDMSRHNDCYEREIAALREERDAYAASEAQLQTRLNDALADNAHLCAAMRIASSQIAKGMEIEAEATLCEALGEEAKDE
jgi:hypothetical protein